MVHEVLTQVSSIIAKDTTLSMQQNIPLMTQNAMLRLQRGESNETVLKEFKDNLSALNAQINNATVTECIDLVNAKILESQRPNKDKNYTELLNEYSMNDPIKRLMESSGYSDPILRGFIDNMRTQLNYAKVPHFKYIPVVLEGLNRFVSVPEVKVEVDAMQSYIDKNHKKLLVLEAIYELERVPGKMYNSHVDILKEMLFENRLNSAWLSAKYKGLYKAPLLENLIVGLTSLEKLESNEGIDVFIGSTNPYVKVYNYLGPVLKEEKQMTVYIDNNFINIRESNEGIDLNDYSSVIENKSDLFIGVMKSYKVAAKSAGYIKLVEAFVSLPVGYTNEGLAFNFKRFVTEFKLNDKNTLDVYLNSVKIDEGLNEKIGSKMSLLTVNEKNNFRTVLDNVDKIFSIDFMKFVMNERVSVDVPGRGIYTVRINENFYVYEYTNDIQRKIFKMDDFQYTKYLHENFHIDASNIFNVKLDKQIENIKALDARQQNLSKELSVLESNVNKIKTALGTKLPEQHVDKLVALKEEIDNLINKKNEELILCKEELINAMKPNELNEDMKLGAGDSVMLKDGTKGKVVSTAPGLGGYIILTENGQSRKITNEEVDNKVEDNTVVEKDEEAAEKTEETPTDVKEGLTDAKLKKIKKWAKDNSVDFKDELEELEVAYDDVKDMEKPLKSLMSNYDVEHKDFVITEINENLDTAEQGDKSEKKPEDTSAAEKTDDTLNTDAKQDTSDTAEDDKVLEGEAGVKAVE